VKRYVLADLYPGVHYDSQSGVVYDEDGHPLQFSFGPFGFFSFHFSHNFAWQVPLSLAERILARSVKSLVPEPGATTELLLADPSLMDAAGSLLPPFELVRFNVFESKLDSEFDLVVCLHLLVERYFDERTIDRGIANLKELVAPGGLLVVGDLEAPKVWRKKSNGEFERLTDV
jgi:SAM-dependent methyltransferase